MKTEPGTAPQRPFGAAGGAPSLRVLEAVAQGQAGTQGLVPGASVAANPSGVLW